MRTLRNPLNERVISGWRARTPRELLATLGRLALWAVLALMLVRGAGQVLTDRSVAPAARVEHGASVTTWPDDAARALAVQFATAYLTHTPREDQGAYARRLTALAAGEVAAQLVPGFARRARATVVRAAAVADVRLLDRDRALVTVAASVATRDGMGVRRVVVPVARDDAGGLIVYDLPSIAPTLSRAPVTREDAEPLLGPERGEIADVLTRFLRAYLAGDASALAYLMPPGTRVAAAAGGFELLSVGAVESVRSRSERERVVLVTVHARDRGSRAVYMLRYRARLLRRDRWYVAEINAGRRPR